MEKVDVVFAASEGVWSRANGKYDGLYLGTRISNLSNLYLNRHGIQVGGCFVEKTK